MISSVDVGLEVRFMHELGITDQLLTLTLKQANNVGAARVVRLHLVIGEFSAVVDDSIQFYWDMMAEGTLAEGAELRFTHIPGRLVCLDCGRIVLFSDFDGLCPLCGGPRTAIHDGSQFRLESIEVEGAKLGEPKP